MGSTDSPLIQTLEKRARIVQQIRAFFVQNSFLEVETPHLIPANAPEPYIDAISAGNGYLHTSPELAMKSLLTLGCPRIFQLCRCWRDQERGKRHLPEFTMLEWYRAEADYLTLMNDCENLLLSLLPSRSLAWGDLTIDLVPPWDRLTLTEAFERYASIPLERSIETDRFEEILTEEVEPNLGVNRPLFLIDYPASMAALARRKDNEPEIAERFELYIGGMEIANAFSELIDPDEQRERFIVDRAVRTEEGKDPYPLPEQFLSDLEKMPEAAGIALGVDRLIMLLCNKREIDEVVAFTWEKMVQK